MRAGETAGIEVGEIVERKERGDTGCNWKTRGGWEM